MGRDHARGLDRVFYSLTPQLFGHTKTCRGRYLELYFNQHGRITTVQVLKDQVFVALLMVNVHTIPSINFLLVLRTHLDVCANARASFAKSCWAPVRQRTNIPRTKTSSSSSDLRQPTTIPCRYPLCLPLRQSRVQRIVADRRFRRLLSCRNQISSEFLRAHG